MFAPEFPFHLVPLNFSSQPIVLTSSPNFVCLLTLPFILSIILPQPTEVKSLKSVIF